jgi:hypothetical protein
MIDVSQFLWSNRNQTGSTVNLASSGGPHPVPRNAIIFGLVKNEIKFRSGSIEGNMFARADTASNDATDIPFQYIDKVPNWAKGANYNDVGEIIGRFEPLTLYSSSTAQDISLNLTYHAENRDSGGWSLEYIEQLTNRLKSLVYPSYDDKFSPPPPMLLNIGTVFYKIPVVIKNVTIENNTPYDYDGFKSHTRKITLEMRARYNLNRSISHIDVWRATNGAIFAELKKQTTT